MSSTPIISPSVGVHVNYAAIPDEDREPARVAFDNIAALWSRLTHDQRFDLLDLCSHLFCGNLSGTVRRARLDRLQPHLDVGAVRVAKPVAKPTRDRGHLRLVKSGAR